MAACREKRGYPNRMAADAALQIARRAWRRDPTRSEHPPVRTYLCACGRWHLTHKEAR